ncbi:hypothetical protein TcasGA2_TC007449 [Tribolium castaneum]|uniref:Uncharacterized protein n=1 Tax=Tribolium castaneum TaxID=7070 RepID=D1ZZI3_TRICA|nr:hypothetical protein TcasGA2_TC007449 [Tribolium castaneum]
MGHVSVAVVPAGKALHVCSCYRVAQGSKKQYLGLVDLNVPANEMTLQVNGRFWRQITFDFYHVLIAMIIDSVRGFIASAEKSHEVQIKGTGSRGGTLAKMPPINPQRQTV